MKFLNVLTLLLVIVGGLNWGLVGLFGFDLVAAIFGNGSVLARLDPPPCETFSVGGVEHLRWRVIGQRKRDAEPLTPSWQLTVPAVQWGNFKSWNEAVDLFARNYDAPDIPSELGTFIDQIAASLIRSTRTSDVTFPPPMNVSRRV